MRIGRVILRVSDLDGSIEFWSQKVGFDVVGHGGPFAFLDGVGIQLALNQVDNLPADHSFTEIVIDSDDVTSTYDELADRGVPFEVELRPVTTDGDRELLAAHFRDPDGHLGSITGWVD